METKKKTMIIIIGKNAAEEIRNKRTAIKYIENNNTAIYHLVEDCDKQIRDVKDTINILKNHFDNVKKDVAYLFNDMAEEIYNHNYDRRDDLPGFYINVEFGQERKE